MNKRNDFKRFLTVLTGVADYYGRELSEGVIELYWQGLQQYDIEAVEKALWTHTQNPDSGQFMPKIADVTKMLQGSTADSALQAWSKVDRAVRTVGAHRSVVFEDPLIHRVIVEMGGWIQLGTKDDEEWPFVRNEFVNRYRGYKVRSEVPDYPPVLIGIAEATNAKNNHAHVEPPMLIGEPKKAERVLTHGTNKPLLPTQLMNADSAVKALRLVYSADEE